MAHETVDLSKCLRLDEVGMHDPDPERIEAAMVDAAVVLAAMAPESGYFDGGAGPGKVVMAQRLMIALAQRGHFKAAAAWALRRLIERGVLKAELREARSGGATRTLVVFGSGLSLGTPDFVSYPDGSSREPRCSYLALSAGGALEEGRFGLAAAAPSPPTPSAPWSVDVVAPASGKRKSPRKPKSVADWAPDEGWHFRPGWFAFRRFAYPLSGRAWDVLKVFAEAGRRPLTLAEIRAEIAAINERYEVADATIRGYIHDVNCVLRKVFRLRKKHGPIKLIEVGTYALDEL